MTLAGVTLAVNGNRYDYNFIQTIYSLLACCDIVIVVAGGDDNTLEDIYNLNHERIKVIEITLDDWNGIKGKERLNHFSNLAVKKAAKLGYEYYFYVQSDELPTERSYKPIREAIATGAEGFMVQRINLWGSPYRYLDVEQDRKPCSTEVIRLAKTNYLTVDDAENIGCDNVNFDYLNSITIYHMGFVRKRSVMKAKIINMQQNVFGMDYDKKLDEEELFNPWLWFDKQKDTKIINEPLPVLIREWAEKRAGDYD